MNRLNLIDTHAHLDDEQFADDLDAVIARAEQGGVGVIICPGTTAEASRAVVRLAETHESIYAAVGIHPNYCGEATSDDWNQVVTLLNRPRVVALGETGMDRHWDFTPLDVQQDYFRRHLRLSGQRDFPLIIHCRECEPDVTAMLREAADRGPLRGVMHAFSGTSQFAAVCLELGLYVSFAGSVTYRNRKFEPLRAVAAGVPDDRLLIETDSPYLVPHPLRGKQKRNEPAEVPHTTRCLAELRGRSIEEIAEQTTANARCLFSLP